MRKKEGNALSSQGYFISPYLVLWQVFNIDLAIRVHIFSLCCLMAAWKQTSLSDSFSPVSIKPLACINDAQIKYIRPNFVQWGYLTLLIYAVLPLGPCTPLSSNPLLCESLQKKRDCSYLSVSLSQDKYCENWCLPVSSVANQNICLRGRWANSVVASR